MLTLPITGHMLLMRTPRRRFLLQQMLSAGTAGLPADPAGGDAYDEEAAWKMKIVDVNRVSKGVKAGSMMRYSALIVVGNANVRHFSLICCNAVAAFA